MKVHCPNCDARVRVADDLPDGKRVRCPECEESFLPADMDEDHPAGRRRRTERKSANTAVIIGAVVAAAIFVIGLAGAGVYFAFSWLGRKANAPQPVAGPVLVQNQPQLVPPRMQPPPKAKAPAPRSSPVVVGKLAPDISGEDADGKKFSLSDYRGKVVVLDFWAGW